MKNKDLRVCLIIPTMDEVVGMKAFMPRIKKEWYDQIIVVDGGSTDGTYEYCQEAGLDFIRQTGKGLPRALRDAFKLTDEEIIVTFSPDGNSIPELIPVLTDKVREGYEMVVVSRYLGGARSYDDDTLTAFGNRMFTGLVNFLFRAKYSDTLCIFRAYRRSAITRMELPSQEEENWFRKTFFHLNSWEFGSSIRAARLKLKVAEIPGDEPARVGGARKLSIIKNGLGTLFQLLLEFARNLNPHDRLTKNSR